jgi:hypothetical protein
MLRMNARQQEIVHDGSNTRARTETWRWGTNCSLPHSLR